MRKPLCTSSLNLEAVSVVPFGSKIAGIKSNGTTADNKNRIKKNFRSPLLPNNVVGRQNELACEVEVCPEEQFLAEECLGEGKLEEVFAVAEEYTDSVEDG